MVVIHRLACRAGQRHRACVSIVVVETRRTRDGERAGVGWQAVSRGVHRRRDAVDPTSANLAAWSEVLGGSSAFTHVTGAALWGLWLPRLDPAWESAERVVVQVPRTAGPVRRRGVRAIRLDPVGASVLVRGLPCAAVEEVLVALARDFSALDALVALDSALQLGLTAPERVEAVCVGGRRGARRLRSALAWADARSESPWETLLRELHRHVQAPVTSQFEVRDSHGRFVARGDLQVVGHRVLHEYDGHHHLEVVRQRADLRRSRRLEEAGWARRGYTAPDLLARPHEILADIDRTLGRAPDQGRLASWYAALAESTFTSGGRRALARRLDSTVS